MTNSELGGRDSADSRSLAYREEKKGKEDHIRVHIIRTVAGGGDMKFEMHEELVMQSEFVEMCLQAQRIVKIMGFLKKWYPGRYETKFLPTLERSWSSLNSRGASSETMNLASSLSFLTFCACTNKENESDKPS